MNLIDLLEKLKYELYGNTLEDYLIALGIFIGVIIILKIFQVFILRKLKKLADKTKTDFDDVVIGIFQNIRPPFYFFIALYFGLSFLTFPDIVEKTINIIFIVAIIFEVVRAFERILDYVVSRYLKKVEKDEEDRKSSIAMIGALKLIARIIIWILAVLMILSNLGVNINSLIASLGITGIAVALALQGILSDVFSSFSIYLDKPFLVGDFIQVGEHTGTVEKIGLKTTRLRSPLGEEIVMSNQELTSARVQNFRRMQKRRVIFSLGIVYGTPAEKLEKVPQILEEVVTGTPMTEFDRCHFKDYGDSSINFETVYYVTSRDMKDYMDTNEKVNLEIYKRFEEEKIEFAYPTQTIFLEK